MLNIFYDKPLIRHLVNQLKQILEEMKTTGRINKRIKVEKPSLKGSPGYYFHADEDFREDWDWGKQKMVSSKAITKSTNKFEI